MTLRAHAGELLLGEADVPSRLHDPDLVLLALRLKRGLASRREGAGGDPRMSHLPGGSLLCRSIPESGHARTAVIHVLDVSMTGATMRPMKQKTVATSDAKAPAKRKRWWFGVLSVPLAVIGLAGIPDDLRTWHRWLSIMDIVEAIRWTALILAPITLAIPLSLEVRDRLQRRRERRRITRAEAMNMLATRDANRAIRRAAREALDLSDPLRRFKPNRFEMLALLDEFESAQPKSVQDGTIDAEALHRWEGQRGRPKKKMRGVWRDLVDAGNAPQTDEEYWRLKRELGPIYEGEKR